MIPSFTAREMAGAMPPSAWQVVQFAAKTSATWPW